MRITKHKFFTSGKPMKRRLAYRIYDDIGFVQDIGIACKKIYNIDKMPLTQSVIADVSKYLGLTVKQFVRRYESIGCHNKDQINRAILKVERDLTRERRPDNWTRYKCGQRWRARFAKTEFGALANKGWGDVGRLTQQLSTLMSKVGMSFSELTVETKKLILAFKIRE